MWTLLRRTAFIESGLPAAAATSMPLPQLNRAAQLRAGDQLAETTVSGPFRCGCVRKESFIVRDATGHAQSYRRIRPNSRCWSKPLIELRMRHFRDACDSGTCCGIAANRRCAAVIPTSSTALIGGKANGGS